MHANQHELSRGVDDQDGPDSSLPYFYADAGVPTGSIAQEGPSELDTHIDTLVSMDVSQPFWRTYVLINPNFRPFFTVQEKELRTQHLENNRQIASLRRDALETTIVRGELAEAQAQAEKERSVMTRWRKSKAYIPHGGRSGGSGTEGGHSTGVGGTGKAKAHIHRRKLGSY
jgi:hypothetical protein